MSMNGHAEGERIGEVIETSTVAFTAQSHDLHRLPALGSLVAVGLEDGVGQLYGVVAYGETAGVDAGRRPVRRGGEGVFDAAIYREHPELALILRTVFQARLVGFGDGDGYGRHLPPTPPPLHYSVRECSAAETVAFSEELVYLRLLLAGDGPVAPEQLLAAHIRSVYAARGHDRAWLAMAAQAVARLFRDEYDRLLAVLQAIEPRAKMPVASGW